MQGIGKYQTNAICVINGNTHSDEIKIVSIVNEGRELKEFVLRSNPGCRWLVVIINLQ